MELFDIYNLDIAK